jgi:Ca-activated chloride channel family protein
MRDGLFGLGLAALVAAPLAITAGPARPAAPEACDIALSLSFDVSVSMDEAEFRHMREGTAAALLDPSVVESFSNGTVFVQVTEWADGQAVLMDWTAIGGRPELERLATLLANAPRSKVGSSTGLGSAILFAAAQFARGPACDRLVLDVAGDGESNTGLHPAAAREGLDQAIQINALATSPQAAHFYETYVIQGAGAFVEQADGYERFTDAMKHKLNFELFMSDADAVRLLRL